MLKMCIKYQNVAKTLYYTEGLTVSTISSNIHNVLQ